MSEPTYDDVARWLPTDVREAVEATTPCPVNGRRHVWWKSSAEIYTAARVEPVDIIEHWQCACGLVHTTDPEKRQ